MSGTPNQAATKAYPYEMKTNDVKQLAMKVQAIQLGDTLNSVLDGLGSPDYGPSGPGKQVPGVLVKNRVEYHVKMQEQSYKSPLYDQWVTFYFDSKDRLLFIHSNVSGIISKGSPTEPLP